MIVASFERRLVRASRNWSRAEGLVDRLAQVAVHGPQYEAVLDNRPPVVLFFDLGVGRLPHADMVGHAKAVHRPYGVASDSVILGQPVAPA